MLTPINFKSTAIDAVGQAKSQINADATPTGSLDEMMAREKIKMDASSATTTMESNVEEVFSWLAKSQSMIVGDPKRLKVQLMDYIKSFKTAEGNNEYNSIEKQSYFVASLVKYSSGGDVEGLEDFLVSVRRELIGISFFMNDFIQRAMFPTVENGGKLLEWDDA